MSWQACAWVTQQTVTATATDQLVLLVLANYAGEDGRNAFPSIARLAREARLTERAVQKSLRRLEDASLIRQGNQKVAEAHIDRKDKRPTVYDLNLSLLEISTVSTGDGVNHVHPAAERGEPDDTSGVNLTPERGEPRSPDPSLNHHKNPSARAGARDAPDGSRSPDREEANRGETPAGAAPSSDAAGPQGAQERERASKTFSEAERERFWRQRFIIDWLKGEQPGLPVLRALGLQDARLSPAAIEELALASRATYLKAVAGFLRWAEACNAGDVSQKPPILTVRELMEALAEPAKRPLMARQMALLMRRDAEIRAGPEDDHEDGEVRSVEAA